VVEMKLVAIISLVLLLLYIMPIPVGAHMPGAEPPPEFEMKSIMIDDGGTEIEITIDDVGNYFNEMAKSMEKQVLQKEHPNWSEEEINNSHVHFGLRYWVYQRFGMMRHQNMMISK
jgi:hypothetical protein